MQKSQIDQGLAFKKRARRRLVGAIALVLLMVIILPMILEDREQRLQQDEVEIIMPNQDLSDLGEPNELEESDAVIEAASPDEVVDDTVTAEIIDTAKKELPVVKAEPKEVAKPKEATKPESEKTTTTLKSNKFYVQIGVFSDLENVKRLQVKLDELGYKSLTEKMTTSKGIKTRLRTEVFDGRNEAAIALENIKDSGLTGMVVNQK